MGKRARRGVRAAALTAAAAGAVGLAGVGYAAVIERNWFRLRHYRIPLLPPGSERLRILHLADAHLTPGRRRLIDFIRGLEVHEPDLVINTGDSIASEEAIDSFVSALGPLLKRPGVFVYGSNDLYAPEWKNPARYLWRSSRADYGSRYIPDLPWRRLGESMAEAGWLDLNNAKATMDAAGHRVALAGIHDSHIHRDRYDTVAGPADPDADVRVGVMHSPEPRNLDAFTADGYQLLVAGHTHGGQLCLPGVGTLVTNCGIDRRRARGLSRNGEAWLHVSAGLGTSPTAPVRFACRPEAALLDVVPRG